MQTVFGGIDIKTFKNDDESLHNGSLGQLYGARFESVEQMLKETNGQPRYSNQFWTWGRNPYPEAYGLGYFFKSWILPKLGPGKTFAQIRVDPTWAARYLRQLGFTGKVMGIDVRQNVLDWAVKTHPAENTDYYRIESWQNGWPSFKFDVAMTAGLAQNLSSVKELSVFLGRVKRRMQPEGYYLFYAKILPAGGVGELIEKFKREGKEVEVVQATDELATVLVPDKRLADIIPRLTWDEFDGLAPHLQKGMRVMTFYNGLTLEECVSDVFDIGEILAPSGRETASLQLASGSLWPYMALGAVA